MSEVSKKKNKKRRHSSFSNDLETSSKRIKVEANDSADDSIVISATDFDRNSSVVEHRQKKKKHKHHRAAVVNVDVPEEDNVELNWTNTVGQYNATHVTAKLQAYESGLDECSSHKRLKHGKQQDSPLQQQHLASSSQTADQLCLPELRYTCFMTSLCYWHWHGVVMHVFFWQHCTQCKAMVFKLLRG